MTTATDIDLLCINTIRTLSIDAVQKARSGHPGTPMGAAPIAYCLWQRFLRYSPRHPDWPDRDRFVLSAGHACALLYSLLHLTGVRAHWPSYPSTDRLAVTLDDLKQFRQMDSRCTGHPEYGWTSGVEVTTGPLGQGVANSVGMAIAGRWLAHTYNRPGFDLFHHNVYALCGDGDMMEGVSSEAASLAGHLALGNLCWIYDDNHISIEGSTELAFTEDVGARFAAYGWQVVRVGDANDLAALSDAYRAFLAVDDRPTLIIVRSHIGYGAPHRQDTREAHGEALGEDEVRLAKEFYGCDPDAHFAVPPEVPAHFARNLGQRGEDAQAAWEASYHAYAAQYPDLARQLDCQRSGTLPPDWDKNLPEFPTDARGLATRDSSGKVLNAVARQVPWLIGGAADLSPSTKTALVGDLSSGSFQSPAYDGSYAGRNFHFGIREHAMCAIANGIAVSGPRAFASSFFVFTDYCRPSLRLSAMMAVPVIYIWTHDSISLGEDGPTHQPVEQLPSLRAMPGMVVIRPADANEVVAAWRAIMPMRDRPVSLVLTRQAVPTFDRSRYASAAGLARGAYVLADAPDGKLPQVLLLASGSEVALCIQAYEQLREQGVAARVVSMPSWELFETQGADYRDGVLPPSVVARVAVEQASGFGWERYVGSEGAIIGLAQFGLSAPGGEVARHFGFDSDHVVAAARAQIARCR
ncbi:MAG: transketolase [Candidimonas sp.]|nr:MAG: transketolase [Candidimonas sp.]